MKRHTHKEWNGNQIKKRESKISVRGKSQSRLKLQGDIDLWLERLKGKKHSSSQTKVKD